MHSLQVESILHSVTARCLSALVPLMPALARSARSTSAGSVAAKPGLGAARAVLLRSARTQASFWLITAAYRSGAHLAGVTVHIVDVDSGRPVLAQTMDGPWLFADLPPGRYKVEAFLSDTACDRLEVQRGQATIRQGEQRRMLLYFHSADATLAPQPVHGPDKGDTTRPGP